MNKEYLKQWHIKNRERRLVASKKWREKEENKEYMREYSKKWNKENKGKRKFYQKKHRVTEKYKQTSKAWQEKNKKEISAYHKERNQKIRLKVLTHYGGVPPKCVCCGEKEIAFLAVDHINGGGNKHRQKVGRAVTYWAYKNNFPQGLQILCHNCNMAKHQQGICPHKK